MFSLPANESSALDREHAPPEAAHMIAPESGKDSERALVLVVERDPHVRDLESFFLNEAGFAVDFAADGAEALELVRKRKPAIVVTEIIVPGVDGLALCRKVKDDPDLAGTVVLVFSILAAQARARDAGADAFLMKPLAERRLVETVKALLAKRAANLQRSQSEDS
jgi:two-component system response regulator MprA